MTQITDEQVWAAFLAYDRKVSELEKYPICENYSRLEIDAEGMRAALTAFLSSVGGGPYAYEQVTALETEEAGFTCDVLDARLFHAAPGVDIPEGATPLYTAEALAARVAGVGLPEPSMT